MRLRNGKMSLRGWMTALLVAMLGVVSLASCGKDEQVNVIESINTESIEDIVDDGDVEITIWSYPIGGWNGSADIVRLIDRFMIDNPGIKVSQKALDYNTGDSEIESAIESGEYPDIVFEGPERLVSNWGKRGLMVDVSDLWEYDNIGRTFDSVRDSCKGIDGKYYTVPLCMSAHCMVVNKGMLKDAGALQYLDEETRTWTADGFAKTIEALHNNGMDVVAKIYCKDQGGDQGTRALVNNLFGGRFTNAEHTGYMVDSEDNIKALEFLKELDGIEFDASISGGEEAEQFCDGKLAMAFCWNGGQELNMVKKGRTDIDMLPMMFPTKDAETSPQLQYGIWGLGVFDSGDEARIEASKKLIKYIIDNESNYTKAVTATNFWPVREMKQVYANDSLMDEYGYFINYIGDYYQVTDNWTEARKAWWEMLQSIGDGADVREAAAEFQGKIDGAGENQDV